MKTFILTGKIDEVIIQVGRIKEFCEALGIIPTIANFIKYQQGGQYERVI